MAARRMVRNESRSSRIQARFARDLQDVLSLLASEPTEWLPIAGGTDLMVCTLRKTAQSKIGQI